VLFPERLYLARSGVFALSAVLRMNAIKVALLSTE
jgi:hypothetical protein